MVSTGSELGCVLLLCMLLIRSTIIYSKGRHVALKLFINSKSMGAVQENDLNIYKRIENLSTDHPGRGIFRLLLDSFDIDSPNGRHQCHGRHRCLVHPPLWENILDFRY